VDFFTMEAATESQFLPGNQGHDKVFHHVFYVMPEDSIVAHLRNEVINQM
jgi:hypothetical protein